MSFGGDASRGRGRTPPVGDIPRVRGHSARAGTGFLSPTASNAPGREGMSLALQDVPGRGDSHPLAQDAPVCVERPCGLGRPRSRTYLSIEDCVLLQKVMARTQSFGGEVRPGRRTQSSMFQDGCAAPLSRLVRAGWHNLVMVFAASTGARRPRWTRLPVPGHSGIGFAPWLQDDASTPTPAPRPCASGPRSRARPTTNRPELGTVPTPPVPLTGPPDVG